MQQMTVWKAFDGRYFEDESNCAAYEENHPFLDHKQIIFYANNGRIIEVPDEHVLIDSNAFEVFNNEALDCYIKYRENLKLKVPNEVDFAFPRHYKFYKGAWICIENEISNLEKLMEDSFKDEVVVKEENRHNLVGESG